LFASRHAWFDHELVAHRKEWACGVCNGHTKSASAFLEHAQSIHQRTFPEKLVSKILQQNERAQTKYKANDCPFCDDWTVNHDDKNVPEDELYVSVKQFRQHVGRHMEELALFVLPVDLGDDFQSEKAAGEAESFNSPPSMSKINEFDNPDDSLARVTEQILSAYDQGDLEEVRNLIQGIDVIPVIDIKGEDGETLLMMLSRFNASAEILYLVVEAGADISAKDSCGRTALLHYFSKISGPKVDLLAALHLLAGLSGKFRPMVDIEAADSTQDGFRVLHWIAWFDLSEACRKILQLGADIEARDREGRTPLRIVMMSEQKEVALLLLDMGADVGEIYPMDLHPEMRSLLGWASSNDRLHVGKLVVHKNRMRQEEAGEGILRRVSKVIRVDSP
jgi:ankyrin repeat protein